jgi:hypothetical protein
MSQIKKDLNGKLKDATEDKSLPICWKGTKPFKSVGDVKTHFKPLVLSFTNAKNIQLQLAPEAYLIVTVSTLQILLFFLPAIRIVRKEKSYETCLTRTSLSEKRQCMLGNFEWQRSRTRKS